MPHPPYVATRSELYVEVPFAPEPPRAEIVPEPPRGDAAYVPGEWQWEGARYRWRRGIWVVSPPGVTFAPWQLVRRGDGRLFLAGSTWFDANGNVVEEPTALARARLRIEKNTAPTSDEPESAPPAAPKPAPHPDEKKEEGAPPRGPKPQPMKSSGGGA